MLPENKLKAVTFSYDDGVSGDIRLVEILNRYKMKCTFNVNTGTQRSSYTWVNNGVTLRRLDQSEIDEMKLYEGHEVAAHSYTHPHLSDLPDDEIHTELKTDIDNIEKIYGERPVGFAYPYGTYNDRLCNILADYNIRYARTVNSTHSFAPQTDLLRFNPTCHHDDEELFNLAKKFIELKTETPAVFYIWGHSFELDMNKNWDRFERLCDMLAGKDDIFYGTNKDVLL